jgi:hypothetical protein
MNLVGKIFTVLIFIMSLVFATFALAVYQTHKNWKLVVDNPAGASNRLDEGLAQQLKKEKDKFVKLEEEKRKVEAAKKEEKDACDKRLAALETANQDLAKQRDDNEKQVAKDREKEREQIGMATAAQKQLDDKMAEAEKLREQIATAENLRRAAFKDVVRITDDLNSAVNERIRLDKMNRELADQLAKARECLNYFKLDPASNYKDKDAPADLQGEITGAPRPDVVEISIGSDDGIRKGHKLEVVRMSGGATSYVGRIEVMETFPDRAVCRTDPKMLRSPVQKGDRVYASLSRVK